MSVDISTVVIRHRKRAIDFEHTRALSTPIAELGLLHPIVVNETNELVAGAHRLEAAKLLGWKTIPVTRVRLDALHRELAEIDENIASKPLDVLERGIQLARRKEIYELLYPETRLISAGANPKAATAAKSASEIISLAESFATSADRRQDSRPMLGRSSRAAVGVWPSLTPFDLEVTPPLVHVVE